MINITKLWDRSYIDITQNNALLLTGNKKNAKKVSKKVLAISDDVKLNVLKLYDKHCQMRHKIKFMQFRQKFSKNDEFATQIVSLPFKFIYKLYR